MHPCVEVNFRMTMGMVSRVLCDRYVHPSASGRFVVDYFRKPGEALRLYRESMAQHPLRLTDGKVLSGYFPLTPASEETAYHAYAIIEK